MPRESTYFKTGNQLRTGIVGDKHQNWRGGKIIDGTGYVEVWIGKGTYVLEHRRVMEGALGRSLASNELVHHRNGVRDDNRLENLQIVTPTNHRGEVRCPYCLRVFAVK